MWTGTSGLSLLGQTLSFVNCVAANYTQITGARLHQAKMLDFGCGYGRIMRPMYFYTDPENMAGIDPWDRSIEICQNDGMMGHLAVSDYLPKSLPVEMADFDLIYSFSVFTHLSERAARTCLKTLRSYIASDGVLVITIRPVEYWHLIAPTVGDLTLNTDEHPDALCHRLNGFAFRPHNRAPIDGDITYGDTSMTLEWLASAATGWEITSVDHSLNDALQLYVFLKPT